MDKDIRKLYDSLKTNREQYTALWEKISRISGLTVNTDYDKNNQGNKSEALDYFLDDPTAMISVNQAGDYTSGIMWGTGQDALELIPSRYALEHADISSLEDYYSFATDQTLYHMNHESAGLVTSIKPYMYDQYSFGTSGIGCFKNQAFVNGIDDNALSFMNYGVDNLLIDEGKSGLIEYEFIIYQWNANRIVGDFAMKDGTIDDGLLSGLPRCIQRAFEDKDIEKEFKVVFGVYPRQDFDPRLKGKRGAKFQGIWFLDGEEGDIFFEEDFAENPIAVARQIKIRGETYGRS
jgi:hypothetical protein